MTQARDEAGRFAAAADMDRLIRRASGRDVARAPRPTQEAPSEGLDGGARDVPESRPFDMDALIRARAGRGPQQIGFACNKLPLLQE